MSNKTQLQENNAKLTSLISELQGKAAGGVGSVETCAVTMNDDVWIAYSDGTQVISGIYQANTHDVAKNSIFVVAASTTVNVTGGAEYFYDGGSVRLIKITGDCIIELGSVHSGGSSA